MKSYFIFNTSTGYYLVESKDVDKIPKPRELIRRASAVEVLREFAAKEGIVFSVDKARARSKHTEETKRKISEGVKEAHPNKDGLTEEHKKKISKNHTGKYRGSNNNMWEKKHRYTTKQKMSQKRRQRVPYKYICGPNGKITSIPHTDPVPDGWQLGRIYDMYRPT